MRWQHLYLHDFKGTGRSSHVVCSVAHRCGRGRTPDLLLRAISVPSGLLGPALDDGLHITGMNALVVF
jgi:hypothetical protein